MILHFNFFKRLTLAFVIYALTAIDHVALEPVCARLGNLNIMLDASLDMTRYDMSDTTINGTVANLKRVDIA